MISMSQTYSIRQVSKSGESISEIARKVGVSRNTVYAKLAAPDLSPQMPVKEPREKMLDAYRPVIEGYLDEDERTWRKQRHTARRIWQRLRTSTASPAASPPSGITSTTSRPRGEASPNPT